MKNETLTAILNEKDKLSAYMGVGVDYYKGETGKSGADEVYIGPEPPTDPEVKLWVDTEDQSLDVVDWNDVENKPNFATVATSGSYNDLTDKPTIPEAPDLTPYAKTADLSPVATSGSYNDLTDKPVIPEAPDLTNYATKEDLANAKPDLTPYAKTADLSTVATSGSYEDLKNKPDLFSGDYQDLTNKPTIPEPYTLPTASYNTLGGVKVSQTNPNEKYGIVYIDSDARLRVPIANQGANSNAGIVLPNADQFEVAENGYMYLRPASISIGGVKADGTTTTVDKDGTIHAVIPPYTLPTATTSTLGGVKVDGTSITIADGVISSTQPTKTSELTNDSGFITNEYHDYTKQNVLVAGDNITIANDGKTISASHPARYIKSADVSGNTLNLTYNNDTSVVFTPTGGSGGGSGGVSGYAFSSTQVLTDADKAHLKEIYINKNIYMTIDNLTVVRIMSLGARRGFIVVNTNGATSNQVLVYTVDIDGSGNVTSNTFTLFMSYYLVGNSSQLTGDIITSENWNQYISVSGGGGADWSVTASTSDSNLYNTKEVVIFWQDYSYNRHQSYLNVGCDYYGNSGQTWGTSNWLNTEIRLDSIDDVYNGCSIIYDGSNINTANIASIDAILYKT